MTALMITAGIIGIGLGVWLLSSILPPFLLGATIAYCFRPVVRYLNRRGLPIGLSALLVTLLVYIFFILLIVLVIPSLHRLILILSGRLMFYRHHLWEVAQPWLEKLSAYSHEVRTIGESLDSLMAMGATWIGTTCLSVLHNSWTLAWFFLILMIAPVIAFHLMKDWPLISTRTKALIPLRFQPLCATVVGEINTALSGYLRGQLMVCCLLAGYYATALSLISLDFGYVVGILTGIFTFLPYIGFFLGLSSALLISLFQQGDGSQVLALLIIYGGGQILESVVLTPWLIGKKTGLHPVIVLLAVLAGGALKGIAGILLALPVATIGAACWRLAKQYYLHTPFYQAPVLPKPDKTR